MLLTKSDPQIAALLQKELQRQREGLEMIASENYTGIPIMEATGSVLTNKYSEGYPGKRYYGGNRYIDKIEQLAIERACTLFGSEAANVQPHSGSQANMAAYMAVLKPGDSIMALQLDQGGHLTHGSPVNFSGRMYNFIPYGVDPQTHRIDLENVKKIAKEHRPKLILTGATAYPREIDFKAFADIAKEVDAYFMVDMAHIAGLIAAKIHNTPVPYADIVTSTTHKTLRGPRGGMILSTQNNHLSELYCPKSKKNLAQKINSAIFPGIQGGPLDHIIAAKAVCFGQAMDKEFTVYQQQTVKNAATLANALTENGFKLISGGTDNHLLLIDLTNKNISGIQAEAALDKSGIHTNRNTIPNEPRSPFDPSGLRLGTPALTTRGMSTEEMETIANLITDVIENFESRQTLKKTKEKVLNLTNKFPLYPATSYL